MNTLNNEILSAIDNIDSCVMEAEMNVIDAMYDYCQKSVIMLEHYEGDNPLEFDVFCEGHKTDETKQTSDSKVKKVFITLWNMIKNFLSWIGSLITTAINYLKTLFKKNKNPGTADQCAEEAGISARSLESGTRTEKIVFEKVGKDGNRADIINDIKIISKDLSIEFGKNGDIKVRFITSLLRNELKVNYGNNLPNPGVKVKDMKPAPSFHLYTATLFLRDKERMTKLEETIELINQLLECCKNTDKRDSTRIRELGNKIHENCNESVNNNDLSNALSDKDIYLCSFNISQLIDMQKRINKMQNDMSTFSGSNIDMSLVFNSVIRDISGVCSLLNQIQMGMNVFTGMMKDSSIIDERYHMQINDSETLDKFVTSMHEHGIPSKFVAYNAYLACSEEYRGSKKYKPVWGQSRIVFIPSDNKNIVRKIALSGFGIQANRNEQYIYEEVKDTGDQELINYFAPVVGLSKKYAVLEMKRLNARRRPFIFSAIKIKDDINYRLHQNNKRFMVDDLHPQNFAKSSDGHFQAIDYGWLIKL